MSITEIKKALNVKIVKANATVNGKAAYKVEGMNGLFSKAALENMAYGF